MFGIPYEPRSLISRSDVKTPLLDNSRADNEWDAMRYLSLAMLIAAAYLISGCAARQLSDADVARLNTPCIAGAGISPQADADCLALGGPGTPATITCQRQIGSDAQWTAAGNCLQQAEQQELASEPSALGEAARELAGGIAAFVAGFAGAQSAYPTAPPEPIRPSYTQCLPNGSSGMNCYSY